MNILGSGTKEQKQRVAQALELAGQDASIIRRIEVYNTDCVEKYFPYKDRGTRNDKYTKTTGFAVRPNRQARIEGNRIVIAGKGPCLEFTTLHELGHLIVGYNEVAADDYAASILAKTRSLHP